MIDLELNSSKDLKREGKSFYWASFFLPQSTKRKAGTLYSICRYFDDIADKHFEDQTNFLKNTIEEIKKNKNNKINLFLQKNKINNKIFIDLIEGLILDQKKIRIQNKEELIKYSYYVAGTVGLMMSKIIGVKNEEAAKSAIDLGIGMQLTNIARDVYEDSKLKRIYLPSNWIPNISLKNLNNLNEFNSDNDVKISKAIHKVINLSEKFYINGFAGLKYIPFSTRLGIFIAANVYKGIGIKIKSNKKKYLRERIYLNSFEKFIITIKSLLLFIFIPLMNYKYQNIRESLPNEDL
ncbi:squalene/phytoene synthase family protein [Pelagibacteraceae bacterium]|nr:squalene/phytoene synthase family protein [Pelagibacteraceae bacterium]